VGSSGPEAQRIFKWPGEEVSRAAGGGGQAQDSDADEWRMNGG